MFQLLLGRPFDLARMKSQYPSTITSFVLDLRAINVRIALYASSLRGIVLKPAFDFGSAI